MGAAGDDGGSKRHSASACLTTPPLHAWLKSRCLSLCAGKRMKWTTETESELLRLADDDSYREETLGARSAGTLLFV